MLKKPMNGAVFDPTYSYLASYQKSEEESLITLS